MNDSWVPVQNIKTVSVFICLLFNLNNKEAGILGAQCGNHKSPYDLTNKVQ